jgi:cell division protein FtsB
MKFYRKIQKQVQPDRLIEKIRENKVRTAVIAGSVVLLFYIVFNSNGIYPRIKLEVQKQQMQERIRTAEEEQKLLKEQSKALDGDPKAIEKVAREKHGMVRENEKVYKVAPKK